MKQPQDFRVIVVVDVVVVVEVVMGSVHVSLVVPPVAVFVEEVVVFVLVIARLDPIKRLWVNANSL